MGKGNEEKKRMREKGNEKEKRGRNIQKVGEVEGEEKKSKGIN
jgi:hypothetical protein